MSRYREWDLSCKVYVGNLGSSASKHEIENAFSKYGPLRNVWVARNPPGFAFVEFEDRRDAEDAVRGLDGSWVFFVVIFFEFFSAIFFFRLWLFIFILHKFKFHILVAVVEREFVLRCRLDDPDEMIVNEVAVVVAVETGTCSFYYFQ